MAGAKSLGLEGAGQGQDEGKAGVTGTQGKGAVVGDRVGRGHDEVAECWVLEAVVKRADVIPKAAVEQLLLQAPQCWALCPWPPHSSPWALREGRREGGLCPGGLSRKRLGF